MLPSRPPCAEFRELLDRLFSWCDLCLPANEQAFAESHRQKIQKFQMQIVQEMKRSNSARSQVKTIICRPWSQLGDGLVMLWPRLTTGFLGNVFFVLIGRCSSRQICHPSSPRGMRVEGGRTAHFDRSCFECFGSCLRYFSLFGR